MMKEIKVKLTFTEPVLGTWASNQNVARDFIASKAPDASTIEDEIAALGADSVADKSMTIFPKDAEAGYPEPPVCPVCGQQCDKVFRTEMGEIVGCDRCLEATDTWEASECFPEIQ